MEALGPIDLSGVSSLAMDEFDIQKSHHYATVMIDPTIKKVLWVGRAHVKAAATDMNGANEAGALAQCPKAEIAFNPFHVVARHGRVAVDRVHVDESNRLTGGRPARKVDRSARWLRHRARDNIKRQDDRIRLDELLAANQAPMTVYVLKDDLNGLWKQRTKGEAMAAWKNRFSRAIESTIKPPVAFAGKLEASLLVIIACTE